MKTKAIAVLLVLSVLSVIVLFQASHSFADTDPVNIIREFTEQPDLALEPDQNALSSNIDHVVTYQTTDRRWIFEVDTAKYQVVYAFMPPLAPAMKPLIDKDVALSSAQSFLTKHVDGFDRLVLIEEKLIDHGAAGIVYSFSFAEELGSQKAIGFHIINISVDAGSGSITNYSRLLPVTVTISTEPKISREEAIAIAQERFNAGVTSSSARLSLGWKNDDRAQGQVLRWEVTLISDDQDQKKYNVDAHDGTILATVVYAPPLPVELPSLQDFIAQMDLDQIYGLGITIPVPMNQHKIVIDDPTVIDEFIQLLLNPEQDIKSAPTSSKFNLEFEIVSKSLDGETTIILAQYFSSTNILSLDTMVGPGSHYSGDFSVPETFGKELSSILNIWEYFLPTYRLVTATPNATIQEQFIPKVYPVPTEISSYP
ncbi:MAG: hypothetical protein EHM70_00340 [Chloroflexota bacterium]|nr:MAG: hypothetical protein EHM70_00340 [Chloroflexota bacterium]